MSSVMEIAMKEMGQLIELAQANLKVLPGPIVNVSGYGAVGDGVTNETTVVQTAIDYAIANGMKAVFFPRGTNGQYYVTALTNANQVVLFGDNASFVGGYIGTILQLGEGGVTQADLDAVEATVNTVESNLNALEAETVTGVYNVITRFGAKGDGVTDDTAAFNAAIAACPAGGTVFIPTPSVKYKLTATIEITKPIKITGFNKIYEVEDGLEKSNILEFQTGVFKGFHVTSYGVSFENFTIELKDVTSGVIAGIHLDSSAASGMRRTHIRDVFVRLFNNNFGSCIKGNQLILSTFVNVHCLEGKIGFELTNSTSVKFDNTWAINQVPGGKGYSLTGCYYMQFTATAADTINGADYAYHLDGSKAVSFDGCGAETFLKSMFLMNNCDGISVTGSLGTNMNTTGTSVATFAELTGTTKNVTLISCVDKDSIGSQPNVRRDASSLYPVIINCSFPIGYSDNGLLIAPTLGYSGGIQIGQLSINENPAGVVSAVVDGRSLGVRGRRVGVMATALTSWLGYIDGDGTIMVGSLGALPTASVTYRGVMARVLGNGTTTADVLYICMMSATGTYSWKTVATG